MDNIQPVVNEEVTTPNVSEDATTQPGQGHPEDTTPPVLAGDKTPPNLLLQAKQEEAEKRRIAEERVRQLEEENQLLKSSAPSSPNDVFSDEGKLIVDKYVTPLQTTVATLREENALKDVYVAHPEIAKSPAEFDEFRKDYAGFDLQKIAKLFISEKGLTAAPRKGLEKPTGGNKNPQPIGYSVEEVANLRKNDFRKYQELIRKDQLVIRE